MLIFDNFIKTVMLNIIKNAEVALTSVRRKVYKGKQSFHNSFKINLTSR